MVDSFIIVELPDLHWNFSSKPEGGSNIPIFLNSALWLSPLPVGKYGNIRAIGYVISPYKVQRKMLVAFTIAFLLIVDSVFT